ncbi:glycosyltransferase [Alicyclobacillus mali]|uniref:4,4'-diaponeurosporenoate glycosyltransferase n=1 Tax=Alicyclobacillus mali (ex Roth et al. 2021) TaxID=1123961 RepID=A0ABS0F3X6_9BACL|nr:glycosyltransferase family 2 protein [Alicyclobacillus mali (ex Roth et al. 2021)]MBF8377954.1 glycosyltransferase [Alicyclobacillus mali (ex Roth et al. 2021)]MCL6489805.1 glycosyltransferase family 2 protein [Alicyclobacillus mali (ex Roth et al. 2021)]
MFSNAVWSWLAHALPRAAWLPALCAVVWTAIFLRTIPDLVRTPRLRPREAARASPEMYGRVSIVVAARDEREHIATTLASLLRQTYADLEIVAVDDRSSDGTGDVIDRMAARDSRIVPVHIGELPRGWLGKNHALYLGAMRATGDWLLFADADVRFYPDAVERAMAYAHAHRLHHLTVAPRLIASGYALKLLTAVYIFNYVLFKRPQSAYRRRTRAHAGIGAFNLVSREAYECIGTHRAISLRPDDDLHLGKLIKRHGFRQRFVVAQDMIEIEWYPSFRSMIIGMEKAPLPAFHYSAALLTAAMILMMALYTTPFAGAIVGPGWYRLLYLYCLVLMGILYELHAVFLRLPKHQFLILPLGMLLYSYAFIRSAVLAVRRGGLVWRDTFYTLRELRRGL